MFCLSHVIFINIRLPKVLKSSNFEFSSVNWAKGNKNNVSENAKLLKLIFIY